MHDERLLTVDEIAKRLRLTRLGIYRRVKLNELPAVRIGRFLRFSERDIADYINAHRTHRAGSR